MAALYPEYKTCVMTSRRAPKLAPITADTFVMVGWERFRLKCQVNAAGVVDQIITSYLDGQQRVRLRRN